MIKNKNTLVISGFPGVGKTYMVNEFMGQNEFTLIDSDSSLFSWLYDKDDKKTDKRNPSFPDNYISYIKHQIEMGVDVIFVSTHEEVRNALKEAGIFYYLVSPKLTDKEDYLNRYRTRTTGINTEDFVNFMDANWNKFIKDIDSDTNRHGCEIIVLDEYKNLKDLMEFKFGIRKIEPGFTYKHFKGSYYYVDDIALHTETNESMVVYHRLGEPDQIYVRPLSMFISEVDFDKYPDSKELYRFTKMLF